MNSGWDTILRRRPEVLIWGRDGIQDITLATHPFVRASVPLALGYLIPPELVHFYADLFIQELGKQLDSWLFTEEIFTEHMHFSAGKSRCDATYEDAKQWVQRDHDTYYNIVQPKIKELAEKVEAVEGVECL
jgi:hypothetical protein